MRTRVFPWLRKNRSKGASQMLHVILQRVNQILYVTVQPKQNPPTDISPIIPRYTNIRCVYGTYNST